MSLILYVSLADCWSWYRDAIMSIRVSFESFISKDLCANKTDMVTVKPPLCCAEIFVNLVILHIDALVQEMRNFSALAMGLRLSCINPSTYPYYRSSSVYTLYDSMMVISTHISTGKRNINCRCEHYRKSLPIMCISRVVVYVLWPSYIINYMSFVQKWLRLIC